MGEFALEDRAGQRLGGRVAAVEDDDAEGTEEEVEELPERVSHARAGLVTPPQLRDGLRRELGPRQQGLEFGEDARDVVGQADLAHGRMAIAFDPADRETVRLQVVVQQPGGGDLLPVVILGVIPEDGDAGDAELRLDVGGQARRREAFHQRVERPAEQSGLLAGDDGHRARDRRAWRPRRGPVQGPADGRAGPAGWRPCDRARGAGPARAR